MRLAVFLTKRERKSLNAGTKEFDLKSAVSYLSLLPDELIKKTGSRTSSMTSGAESINSGIVTGRGAVQFYVFLLEMLLDNQGPTRWEPHLKTSDAADSFPRSSKCALVERFPSTGILGDWPTESE
jgi:hypothetical protein